MSRPHVAVAGPAQTEAMAADLSGSADYHQVLFDQNPNLDLSFHSFTRRGHPTEVPRTTRPSSSTRQWISTTPTRPDTGNTARKQGKKDTGTRPSHGCLTPAEVVEFEALPVAVRRKVSQLQSFRFVLRSIPMSLEYCRRLASLRRPSFQRDIAIKDGVASREYL